MILSIILRKEVADIVEAEQLYNMVKTKLADNPDIEVTADTTCKIPANPQ